MTPEQIRSRVQQDRVDYILAQFVDIHGTPRCKGVPARALNLFLEGSAGFAGAAVSGMGQGPHDHDMIAIPDLGSYTLVPWETGVARLACDITVDGKAWPYCPRTALRRMAAELLPRGIRDDGGGGGRALPRAAARGRQHRAVRPGRRRHAREALLRLQEPGRLDGLPPHAGRIPRPARLGALRLRPRGRDGAVRDQLEVLGRPDDRGPRHLLQDDDEPGGQDVRGHRDPHAEAVRPPDRAPARTSTSRSGTPRRQQNLVPGRARRARPRAVPPRVPLPRRRHRARPRPRRRRRPDRERLQAPLGRRVPDRGHLGLHLDPRVHQLRRQQPHPDVPGTRAGALRVPPRVRLREPVSRHGRLHRRRARRHSLASSIRESRTSGRTCTGSRWTR